MKIDAHQHFWKYDPIRDLWITDNMNVIRRNFMPADLIPELEKFKIEGTIAVQADQSENENEFLLKLSRENNFIKGIVGWVDFQDANLEEKLSVYSHEKLIKGFRHVLQGEADRSCMLRARFVDGIGKLEKYGYTYDILIYPDQLAFSTKFVSLFPNQKFIIDHLGKPGIKNKEFDVWKKDIVSIAKFENVCCKISGMITEADWKSWRQEDFIPYMNVILEAFGTKRILFGSDWPSCLVAGKYEQVVSIPNNYFEKLSISEQDDFWGLNAIRIYNIT